MLVAEISLKSCIGSNTLNTKSLVAGTNLSVRIFFCLNTQPSNIIKNIGTVELRLNTKFSKINVPPFQDKLRLTVCIKYDRLYKKGSERITWQ